MNSEILIYSAPDGNIKIDVHLENETVWLTQAQICELFQKSKSTISEHIKHIFEEMELDEKAVVRDFRTTASDGKEYELYVSLEGKNEPEYSELIKVKNLQCGNKICNYGRWSD